MNTWHYQWTLQHQKHKKKTLSKRVKNALRSAQKHFLKTICGPNSSYSSALIQALPRSGVRARAAPPLHTEKSRSRGLTTRTHALRSAGTMCRISCCRRSGRPGSSVFPPAQNHMLEQLCSDWTVQRWRIRHTWQKDVSHKTAAEVDVWPQNGLEDALVHPVMISTNQLRPEEDFRCPVYLIQWGSI